MEFYEIPGRSKSSVAGRFAPSVAPDALEEEIEKLL